MSDAFIGEIRLFSYTQLPRGWLPCDGRSLPVTGNQALYALIGTAFGGNQTNFNLPNLSGATGLAAGTPLAPNSGAKGGTETVALTTSQIPSHSHSLYGVAGNGTRPPANGYFAQPTVPTSFPAPQPPPPPVYDTANPTVPLNAAAIATAGSTAPHENRQPFLVQVYAICTSGIFPTRN